MFTGNNQEYVHDWNRYFFTSTGHISIYKVKSSLPAIWSKLMLVSLVGSRAPFDRLENWPWEASDDLPTPSQPAGERSGLEHRHWPLACVTFTLNSQMKVRKCRGYLATHWGGSGWCPLSPWARLKGPVCVLASWILTPLRFDQNLPVNEPRVFLSNQWGKLEGV